MKSKKRAILVMFCVLCLMTILPLQALAAAKASIKLDTTSTTIKVGNSLTLNATVTGKSSKVTWTSSNKKIATVSSTGKVKAVKAGNVTITAKANGKTAKCKLTVKNKSYKELYKAFLAKEKVKVNNQTINIGYFYILNINKKGVPELIITDKYSGALVTYYVYSIIDGKVKCIGSCTAKGLSNSSFYYSKKYKGLYVGGWINFVGGAWESLYCMNSTGKKLSSKYWAKSQLNPKGYWTGTSSENCKKVTKAKCSTYSKKYFKNLTRYEMHANTAANRANYVK